MTPLRKKENLQADLVGLEHLLSITPEDPLATPLLKSRIEGVKNEINKLGENPPLTPEAEIFFKEGPVIGSLGIEASFAGRVMSKFQDMVSNHFAAKFCGVLRRMGRRKGEADSRLYLTALPIGSFGLQLSQPHVTDFVIANQLSESMEDVTGLIEASAKSDELFLNSISNFNGRVLVPLRGFFEVLNNAGSDCRVVSGNRQAVLNKKEVEQGYERVVSSKEEITTIKPVGKFWGVLVRSGKFEFEPTGESLITGWLAEEVSEEQANIWDRELTGVECQAEIKLTTVSTTTGRKSCANELVNLKPLQALPNIAGIPLSLGPG